jgi:hypothetical protein
MALIFIIKLTKLSVIKEKLDKMLENMLNENFAEEVCKNILKSIRIKVLSFLLKLRLVLIGIPDFFSHEIHV